MSELPEPSAELPRFPYKTREEMLASTKRLPPYPAMVIEGLTDEEEEAFLRTINEA